jgi:hypothetical protein
MLLVPPEDQLNFNGPHCVISLEDRILLNYSWKKFKPYVSETELHCE